MSINTSTGIPTATPTSVTILVNIKDIKGRQLPNVGILRRLDKFHVEFVIDEQLKYKTGTAKGNAVSWTESFYFNALGSSMLECRVYKHKVGGDSLVGATNGTIEALLAEGAVGAISRNLFKCDAHGNQTRTQRIVEFTISKASDAAAGLDMKQAVVQEKNALHHMKSAPSSVVEPIQEAIDTSTTVTNNIKSVSDTWGPLLQKIKLFSELVDKIAEVHPYAKMAWSILSATHKTILAQVDRDNRIVHLVEVIDDVYSFVEEADPIKKIDSQHRIVALIAQQTTECAYFIRDYATHKSFWERTLKNSFISDVDNKITQYEDKFKQLKTAFQDSTILQTGITVSRIFDNLESLDMAFDLSGMFYAKGARFDSDKGCLPGTRESIIEEITEWVNSPNTDTVPRIFFLSGVAGFGKSAIAHTVAQQFDQLGRLGSSYCFDLADQANRHPSNLLSTIARDIATLDRQWKTALFNVVKGNPSLQTTRSATEQLNKFILEPAKALTTIGPIVIVIDAFDESGDSSYRKTLLEVLARRATDLPANFRILITSRPERDISQAFSNNQRVFCKHLDNINKSTNEHDISLFIEMTLSDIEILESEWPNKEWCHMLLNASDGLFQWASTACRAIKDGEGGLWPTELLTRFCSLTRGLDPLYSEVLSRSFNPNDATVMSRFKSVMGRIMAAKEPLSVAGHSYLYCGGNDAKLVTLVTQSMGSLLSGVNQTNVPVRALHASFFDFLADESRSESYYVDTSQQNRSLTLSTFRVMKSDLRFNICGLETSHLRNMDVPDLATRIENTIRPHLSYACRFWAGHLIVTAYDTTILYELRDFLLHRLLYWLEVLSLLKNIHFASGMLLLTQEWNQDRNDNIVSFVKDAVKFVSVFGPPISQSAPHIYISALPFAPENSPVAKHYLPQFPETLHVKMGRAGDWPANISVFEGHTGTITSVVFSQDDKRIVSGSWDRTICVWDAEIGGVVVGPLRGHTSLVLSVALSQDGKRIVSGSSDQTIRIWDAETGDVVGGPLKGHTNDVNSVAFSQDGKHIVSGSDDETIYVWDAETGGVLVGPLKGHTSSVTSATFSRDGKRIVSSSSDQTIIWDAEIGDIVVGPLEGHIHHVTSVAFSSDGKCIVAGSGDQTIYVWDAETGGVIVGPLEGHTSPVTAIALSQDGKRIISGSRDCTIRVWDAETGGVIVGPLEGHTDWLTSIAFSQDGKRIVSGSWDRTICVWDAETRDAIAGLGGHTAWITSVTFSQDGKRIVSGSIDATICIWDAEIGGVVVGPLQGHTNSVLSVALSQDGKQIVSGSYDRTIRIWDADTGDVVVGPLEGHTNFVISVAFSQDGKRIVSGSNDWTIRVWDAETGDVIVGPLEGHTDFVTSVTFSQDGKHIVSGSWDQTIRVWDAEIGSPVVEPLQGHTSSVTSIALSQDGKRIISGSVDCTIHVWDADTGDIVVRPLEGHTNLVASVAFSQDGKRIVSGSDDRTIRVWDAETGGVIVGPLRGHTGRVTSVAFSQDGKHIVSGSYDQTIRIWDAETGGVVVRPLEGHTNDVNSIPFSQDRKQVVSGSSDRTICVWDADTEEVVVGSLNGHCDGVHSIASFPDGKCVMSSSDDYRNEFKDTSSLENGWIVNSETSSLLFWVPSWNRPGLYWPRSTMVMGRNIRTQLDLHHFVHGDSWQQCKA